jgi:release factor glutamine methyltransferase
LSTIQELFQEGKSVLKDFPQPHLEAKQLILKCLSLTEEQFLVSLDRRVSRSQERCFKTLISKRIAGVPLPYLTGIKEFWSIPFRISPGVLIPRPETELLVEKTLELSKGKDDVIVDVGTGCGNIAVSLAKERPDAKIYAIESSKKALQLARRNASEQGISTITFASGNLFTPLEKLHLKEKCDFIVSNPPYVSEPDWEKLNPEIRDHEPKSALVAGKTGLEVIELLIQEALLYLKSGGYLLFEIGYNQKDEIQSMFNLFSSWRTISFLKDLAGKNRVAFGRKEVFPVKNHR